MSKHRSNSYLIPDTLHRRRQWNYKLFLYLLLVCCVAALAGGLIYWFFSGGRIKIIVEPPTDNPTPTVGPVCTGVPGIKKFDCYPDAPVSENQCLDRGCCYAKPKENALPPLNVPYCYYPANYSGYVITDVSQDPVRVLAKLKRNTPSGFPNDVPNLNLVIYSIDDCSLRIKITDADSTRYEVPIPLNFQTKELKKPCHDVQLDSKSGRLTILRKSSKTIIFQTDLSRLVYSDQLLQLSSDLPSTYFYGIGEHYAPLLRSVNWTRFTLMNSDLGPIPNHGLYGSQPFYMVLENDGNAHGVFLLNSNPMDVILQPAPAVTFRPIGGILDFFIMLGPSPENVVQQHAGIIGRTFMPPYWSLGFHLCRYGYNSLNKTRETMQRTINAGIPLDVQWNDIDYMENYKDFTYDKDSFAGLPEFIDDLHKKGMHYVVMTDPGISNSEKVGSYQPYDEGIDDDIFVKAANGSILVGKVWTDGTTVFPDFSHPAVTSYWTRQFRRLHEEVKFDGVWIDMNEPSNFVNGAVGGCPKSSLENPPYVPGGVALNTKTACMTAKHYYTVHYNEHNIYGYREAVSTNEALRRVRKRRPFIISRATFAGQGVHSGHWSGDISSTWEDMRYTIPSMLNFNMYGIPMTGSDICGFNSNTTVELCARWQELGAFYPFSRNHNERVTREQDPVALGETVIEATINSLSIRYTLLPYLYTLFYRSHAFGDSVARPLFFEFPNDVKTYSIDKQFLWGSNFMVIPCLNPNETTVTAYFPAGLWYGNMANQIISKGEEITLNAPVTYINVAIRGGAILPMQIAAGTTTASRKNAFVLTAALDENNEATGELYWDDGDSLETYENGFFNLMQFSIKNNVLNTTVCQNAYPTDLQLSAIQIAGFKKVPSTVTVNGVKCSRIGDAKQDPAKNETLTDLPGFFNFNQISNLMEAKNETCVFSFPPKLFMIGINALNISMFSPLTASWSF